MQRVNMFARLIVALSVLWAPMAVAETGVSGVRIPPFPSGVAAPAQATSSERTLFTVVLSGTTADPTAIAMALCATHGCEMRAVRFEERSADLLMTTHAADAIKADARVASVAPAAPRKVPLVTSNATSSSHDCGTGCWTTGIYRYDPAGNVSSTGTETYRYDGAGRLAVATLRPPDGTAVTARYTYDAFGNIHSASLDSSVAGLSSNTFGIDRDTNRFSANQYDAAGNVTRDASSSATMQWDGTGMMARYSGGRRSAYIYTADDERIATFDLASGGSPMRATWTVRGPGNNVLRVFESFGGSNATDTWRWLRDYVHGPAGRLLASHDADGVRHFHLDHLGTPRLITDEYGVKLAEHGYAPFGAEITDSSQDTEPMKFTGHEREFAAAPGGEDVDYMHARFYSPRAGRFLSVDPVVDTKEALQEPQMWNRYAYVTNNPLQYTDPDGRYRTFYKEKSLREADIANAPPVIKAAFLIQGGLLIAPAAGEGAVAAMGTLARAAFTAFPRLFLSMMGVGMGMTGGPTGPSLNLGSGAKPIAGAINVDNFGPGYRGTLQQVQVAGDVLALPFKTGSVGNVTAQNLPSLFLGQGGQQLAGELGRTMQSGAKLSISTQTPGALKAFAELLQHQFKEIVIKNGVLTAIRK